MLKSVGQKILASFFQSVTTRTAGFDALIQNNLTDLSKAWGTVLMMIGGASGSTAGGVKLGTAVLVIMTLISVLRGKSDVVIHGRRVAHTTILHAMALLVLWLMLVVGGSVLISYIDNQDLINSIYESCVGIQYGRSFGRCIGERVHIYKDFAYSVYVLRQSGHYDDKRCVYDSHQKN